ncbi:MAG: alpha/beta hydrolase, partial [Anaerolineales bacterium]|nr:alpha/beta hydrolase [Anaerolineales bacterium]
MNLRKFFIVLGAILVFISLGILIGPFLVPIPPLEEVTSQYELADLDSQFVKIGDVDIHNKTRGQGEPVFVLLHGFGANLYSWNAVIDDFGKLGTVIAYDRVAFGLSERPMEWLGENPYSAQAAVATLFGILDHFGVDRAILVGNSAGGTVSMEFYLQYPQRVEALILVSPAVYGGGGTPSWMRPILHTPQMQRLGPLLVRRIQRQGQQLIELAWHDPSKIDSQTIDLYRKPLMAENWDKALWYFTTASQPNDLPERLEEFRLPALIITGDDDRIVPTDSSIRLAGELPGASLVILENAGHLPHEEVPSEFM